MAITTGDYLIGVPTTDGELAAFAVSPPKGITFHSREYVIRGQCTDGECALVLYSPGSLDQLSILKHTHDGKRVSLVQSPPAIGPFTPFESFGFSTESEDGEFTESGYLAAFAAARNILLFQGGAQVKDMVATPLGYSLMPRCYSTQEFLFPDHLVSWTMFVTSSRFPDLSDIKGSVTRLVFAFGGSPIYCTPNTCDEYPVWAPVFAATEWAKMSVFVSQTGSEIIGDLLFGTTYKVAEFTASEYNAAPDFPLMRFDVDPDIINNAVDRPYVVVASTMVAENNPAPYIAGPDPPLECGIPSVWIPTIPVSSGEGIRSWAVALTE